MRVGLCLAVRSLGLIGVLACTPTRITVVFCVLACVQQGLAGAWAPGGMHRAHGLQVACTVRVARLCIRLAWLAHCALQGVTDEYVAGIISTVPPGVSHLSTTAAFARQAPATAQQATGVAEVWPTHWSSLCIIHSHMHASSLQHLQAERLPYV